MSELVDGGERVIPSFELLAQLGEGSDDRADDEFAGDQLAERELLAEHETSAHDQQGRRGQHLEGEQADDLAHEHAEMPGARLEVITGELIGPLARQSEARRPLEQARVAGDLFEPADRRILAARFGQAGGDRAPAEDIDHETQPEQRHEHVGEQERVVEPEHDQADDGSDDDVDAVQQKHRRTLLDRHDVQEAIDHLRSVHTVEGLRPDAREAPGHVGREPDEDPSLDMLGDDILQAADDRGEHETAGQRDGDEDQRLLERRRLRAEREIADDPVDGERQGEIE